MSNFNEPESQPISRIEILTVMGVAALVILAVGKTWQHLGRVELLSWQLTPWACLISLGVTTVIILTSSLTYRFWPEFRANVDTYLELMLKPLAWPDLIWLGLLPGLSEEFLFRGVMLPALGLNWTALIISSVVFGAIHMSSWQQWPYALHAAFFGFLLGYAALVTENLMVPMIAHTLTNLISGVIWKLGHLSDLSSP